MALSRVLAALAASLCIAALLAASWAPRSSTRLVDLSSSQLAEEIRDDLDFPEEVLPPDLGPAPVPHALMGDPPPFDRTGLGPRAGHLRLLLRPPRS
jgi:hypothetical protein